MSTNTTSYGEIYAQDKNMPVCNEEETHIFIREYDYKNEKKSN